MKLYCVLFDTMPFTDCIRVLGKLKGMDLLRQVGNCYTFASLTSMFTGRLACDLLKGGIGWETWKNYYDEDLSRVNFPWKAQSLPDILRSNGWKINVHNNCTAYKTMIDGDSCNEYSNIIGSCKTTDHLYKHSLDMRSLYSNEKDYIREIQAEESGNDMFYFFYYDNVHHSIVDQRGQDGYEAAKDRTYELLEYWNLTEPNAMFWFFGDHGNWVGLGNQPTPEHYLSWVLFKDNTFPSIDVKSRFISITDFYATVVDKLRLSLVTQDLDTRPIWRPQIRNRIYYVEDAREKVDKQHSTTGVACRFVDWHNNVPGGILQVTYYKPNNTFTGTRTTLNKRGFLGDTIEVEIDNGIKEALISRINWIKTYK